MLGAACPAGYQCVPCMPVGALLPVSAPARTRSPGLSDAGGQNSRVSISRLLAQHGPCPERPIQSRQGFELGGAAEQIPTNPWAVRPPTAACAMRLCFAPHEDTLWPPCGRRRSACARAGAQRALQEGEGSCNRVPGLIGAAPGSGLTTGFTSILIAASACPIKAGGRFDS